MEEPDRASVAQQEMLQVWGTSLAKPSDAAEKRGNEREEEWRPDKWSRPASGRRWEDWDNDKSKDQGQPALDEPTVHLLKTLTKLTLRLEEEMGRFRADTCFMLFVDTVTEQNTLQLSKEAAQGWQTAFEEGKVTTSLRIILLGGLLTKLKEVLLQVNTDDGLRSRLMTVGWQDQESQRRQVLRSTHMEQDPRCKGFHGFGK